MNYVGNGAVEVADYAPVSPGFGSTSLANDIALQIGALGTASNGRTLSISGSYTELDSRGVSNQLPLYLWGKVAVASEAAPTITPSGGVSGNVLSGVGILVRNALTDINSLVHAVNHEATLSVDNDTPIVTPSLTVTQDGCLILLYLSYQSVTTSLDDYDPGGAAWTPRIYDSTTVGNNQTIAVYSLQQTTATNIAGSSINVNGPVSSTTARAVIIALNPGTISATAIFPWLRAA